MSKRILFFLYFSAQIKEEKQIAEIIAPPGEPSFKPPSTPPTAKLPGASSSFVSPATPPSPKFFEKLRALALERNGLRAEIANLKRENG